MRRLRFLPVCTLILLASTPGVQAISAAPEVTFTPLAPGVWMHTSHLTLKKWGKVPSNGLIVETDTGSILVDTAWNDSQTREIITWASQHLHKPIQAAVFTHAHEDKMGGVRSLRQQGIVTYASAESNRLAPGRGLMPAEHNIAFNREHLAFNLNPLVILDPGPGHTTDNIVVGLPTHSIVFGGCLIRPAGSTNLGNTADGNISHWGHAALAVANQFPEAQIVVPSHGPPAGRELFALTQTLAQATQAAQTPHK